jgi:pimeloyl-ACP methyl ester carboxylesterase
MSVQQLAAQIARDRAALAAATRPYATADGRRVPVARFGAGTPVVCAPSVPDVDFIYLRQIEHLAQHHEVFLHQPRLSRSRRVGLEERRAELEAVVDALDVGPVHLLAWSDSGSYAYRAAGHRPDLFRSLALLGLPDRYAFPRPVQAFAELLYRHPIEATLPAVVVSGLLARYMGGPRFSRRCLFQQAQRIRQLPEYLKHSILPMMLDHAPDDSPPAMPSIVVGGDRDALVPVSGMRRMAALLGPETEFILVPGGEHMLGYCSPRQVNSALDQFYARVETTTPQTTEPPR